MYLNENNPEEKAPEVTHESLEEGIRDLNRKFADNMKDLGQKAHQTIAGESTGLGEKIAQGVRSVPEKAKELLDKTDIDEKIVEGVKSIPGKAKELLDKTDLDEKIVEGVKSIPGKAKELLDKTDIDEKIVEGVKGIGKKVKGFFSDK